LSATLIGYVAQLLHWRKDSPQRELSLFSPNGLLFASGVSAQTPSPVTKVVETYCSGCHNGRVEPSGARLTPLDPANVAAGRELWTRAERHLRAGTMPPFGAPRPDRRTLDEVIAAIERELDTPEPAAETSQAIATRLATLLWNAAPDAPLMEAAKRDQLHDIAVLEAQVRRMLADPRSEAFVSRFFFPWLQLDKLGNSDPDKRFFPDYDPSLREFLRRETELFLLSQLRDDHDPVELWTANYTFLNEQLAKHYGIPDITGSQFRRVVLRSPERVGLLGQGSILMVTSRHQHGVDAAYTSPATRGKWVLTLFGRAHADSVSRRPTREPRPSDHRPDSALAREPLHQLPPQLLPARLRTRKLRPNRALAHPGSGGTGRCLVGTR